MRGATDLGGRVNTHGSGGTGPADSPGSPDHDRSGATVEEAVETAEAGSQVDGPHTPDGHTASGESRVERIRDAETGSAGAVDSGVGDAATQPEPRPSPADMGSGGAQRIDGARVSDRVAAGEPVPDGPPFDTDSEGNPGTPRAPGVERPTRAHAPRPEEPVARIEHVSTSGTFSLDGGTWDVDNNVWLIGDDTEVLVVDAPHDAMPIVEAVAGRRVVAIVCTHGHNDHINAVLDLQAAVDAPIWLNPADRMLWDQLHPTVAPDREIGDGTTVEVAGVTLTAIHTPGHSPGSTCLYAPELDAVFSGDTLFAGGPGATGRSYSSHDTIVESIRTRLLTLPAQTVVHTGHGDTTTIGAESDI